jgi:hypothetical protein
MSAFGGKADICWIARVAAVTFGDSDVADVTAVALVG